MLWLHIVTRNGVCVVHCVRVYSIQYRVYSIQCTVNSIQYTVYSVQYTVYSIQCTVYSIQYFLVFCFHEIQVLITLITFLKSEYVY